MMRGKFVPPDPDTLWIKGFSSRNTTEKIQEYFEKHAGHCTMEFFRRNPQNNTISVALKFESEEAAKRTLLEYDRKEVLGNYVGISYFKDLRKAFQEGRLQPQSRYYNNNSNSYYNNRPFRSRYRSGYRSRSGSRSRSYSRSQSRSYTRSRSRTLPTASPGSRKDRRRRTRSYSTSGNSSQGDPAFARRVLHHKTKSATPEPAPTVKSSVNAVLEAKLSDASSKEPGEIVAPPPRKQGTTSSKAAMAAAPAAPLAPFSIANKRLKLNDDVGALESKEMGEEETQMVGSIQPNPASKGLPRDKFISNSFTEAYDPPIAKKASRLSDPRIEKRSQQQQQPAKSSENDAQYENFLNEINSAFNGNNKNSEAGDMASDMIVTYDDSSAAALKDKAFSSMTMSSRNTSSAAAKQAKEMNVMVDEGEYSLMSEEASSAGPKLEKRPRPKSRDHRHKKKKRHRHHRRRSPSSSTGSSVASDHNDLVSEDPFEAKPDEKRIELAPQQIEAIFARKQSIEKSYRRDCETFSTVVKMLISKDPSLEEKLQFSLKENLRDLGRRCITEMQQVINHVQDHAGD